MKAVSVLTSNHNKMQVFHLLIDAQYIAHLSFSNKFNLGQTIKISSFKHFIV